MLGKGYKTYEIKTDMNLAAKSQALNMIEIVIRYLDLQY